MSIWARQKAVDRLDDRLRKLEDLCSGLERDRNKLDMEFTDLYDKVRHQMSRMAKRDAVAQKENGEQEIEEVVDDGLDPISRSIMLRRGMPRMKR